MRADQLPLGHEFEPPPGVAMTDPAYDECTHRADQIGTVCGAPDGAHDAATAWAYDPTVICWDWKDQIDLDALARLLEPLGVALTTIDTGGDEYAVRISGAAPETPHAPVEGNGDGPGAPGSATGGLEPEIPAQTIDGRPLTASEIISRTLVLAFGTSRHDRAELREIAEALAAALRPVHYRESAASLQGIADHWPDTASADDLRPGLRYAAALLDHTADDLTEGNES